MIAITDGGVLSYRCPETSKPPSSCCLDRYIDDRRYLQLYSQYLTVALLLVVVAVAVELAVMVVVAMVIDPGIHMGL